MYLMCSCISELFRQSKINCINQIALLSQTHQEIVWLHITMNKIFAMNKLNATNLKNKQNLF